MTDFKTYITDVIQSQNSPELKIALIVQMVEYTRDKFYDEGYKDGMVDMKDELLEDCLMSSNLF